MKGYARSVALLLASSAATLTWAQVAQAQASGGNPGNAEEAGAEEIIVTGLRASVESAQNIKRNADTIVDSIVAEDVGKFPDQNVVESLGRIPGVQISRKEGEGSGITVRGLKNVKTVLNGRELFGGNSDGNYSSRDFNLGDLPSEVLAGVDVYKSSSADQLEGGLGGYVNVRTRRPFDFSGFNASISAKGTYYDRTRAIDGKIEPAVSALISDRWQTGIGEIGALFNIAYSNAAISQDRQHFEQMTSRADFAGSGQTVFLPSAPFLNGTQSGTHERLTMVGSLQWKPSDSLSLYADGYYVKYKRKLYFADFRVGLGTETSDYILFPDSNDLQSGRFLNSRVNSATAYGDEFRTTQQYALGGEWNNGGRLTVKAEGSYTNSDNKATLDEWDTAITIPQLDYSISKLGAISMTTTGVDISDPGNYKPVYLLSILLGGKQHATTGKVDVNYDLGGGFLKSIDAGFRYSDYVAKNQGYISFYCINDTFAGSSPCGGGSQTSADIPSNFVSMYPSMAGSFVGWNVDAMRQSTDMRAYFGLPTSEALQDGVYLRNDEKTSAFYAKLNYSLDLGGAVLDGNIGGRYVHTSLTSSGFGTDPGNVSGPQILLTSTASRNDFLPSANGRLKFSDSLILRMAYSKTLERIPFQDLNPAVIITNQAQHEARSGNQDLQPFKSTNFDVSLESYFSKSGLLYVAGFYKKVDGYLQTVTFDNQTVPGLSGTYRVTKKVNGAGGKVKGVELGAQTFFDFLPGPFDGFGIQANYTFVDSAVPSPIDGAGDVQIEGLAKHSYNLIGLYDKGPLSARLAYSWRGKVVSQTAPAGGNGAPNISRAFGVLDFSISYDINDRLTLTVDGANILGAMDRSYFFNRTTLPNGELQTDRRFGLQVRYKLGS